MLKIEKAKREKIGEDGFVDLGQVVVREVNCVQFEQLRKSSLRDVDDGVVAHVQNNYSGLVIHRNLK